MTVLAVELPGTSAVSATSPWPFVTIAMTRQRFFGDSGRVSSIWTVSPGWDLSTRSSARKRSERFM